MDLSQAGQDIGKDKLYAVHSETLFIDSSCLCSMFQIITPLSQAASLPRNFRPFALLLEVCIKKIHTQDATLKLLFALHKDCCISPRLCHSALLKLLKLLRRQWFRRSNYDNSCRQFFSLQRKLFHQGLVKAGRVHKHHICVGP